ncbi:MAG: type II toxin-antitoxin system VapC family toxin [Thaumarchaeota archaeon]|nr:type II toxin-antitoxin system VapC family toxin [Nitrososphaerota archaeon]
MNVYDTRFFIEHYYSKNDEVLKRTTNALKTDKNKVISAIVVHEVYKLTLDKEGKEQAELRTKLLEKDFRVINVDTQIAKISAKLRHKYRIPMADSIIAATAESLKLVCITDDQHFTQVKEVKTKWI